MISATRSRQPEPVRLVGHSMGGLHSWCSAAPGPELALGSRGGGHGSGLPRPYHRAVGTGVLRCRSNSVRARGVYDESGPVAAKYFLEAFDRPPRGGCTATRSGGSTSPRNGEPGLLGAMAAVTAPTLLIEAGNPPSRHPVRCADGRNRLGQLICMSVRGHLIHDDAPAVYATRHRVSNAARPAHRRGRPRSRSKRVRIASRSCSARSGRSRPCGPPAARRRELVQVDLQDVPLRCAAQPSAAATRNGETMINRASATVMAVLLLRPNPANSGSADTLR